VVFTPPGSAAAAAADVTAATAAEAALAAAPPRPEEVQVVESQFSLHPGEFYITVMTVHPLPPSVHWQGRLPLPEE